MDLDKDGPEADAAPDPEAIRRSDGFRNEIFFVLPHDFLMEQSQEALLEPLRVTDIGYFPKADHHDRERTDGCDTAILLYCRDGWGHVRLGNEPEFMLHAGQAAFIPPSTPHRYRASLEQPWSVYWVHLSGTMIPRYAPWLGTHNPVTVHPQADGDILREFHRCFALLRQTCQQEEYFLVCQSAGTILALIAHGAKLSRMQLTKKGEIGVEACIRHMEMHLDHTMDMMKLTKLSGFSASHLSALFKQSTGYAPMEYFHRMQMQAAAQELYFTRKSVKEIGLMYGIPDPYYFSRLFKRVLGVSPAMYREQTIG
jgi:AraC-like DNA-binding protein